MTARRLAALAVAAALAAGPAAAHHVATYVPKDNAVSANFKQIKFSLQARKFDVALSLFEAGALRREMAAQAARLPAGLEAGARAALAAGNAREAERHLMIFFSALARDLAVEAARRIADPTAPREERLATGRKFLEAIWRYYNLIDFAVSTRDSKASVAMRLAFDEAETYAGSTAAPAAVNPCAGSKPVPVGAGARADPDKLRQPLLRMAQVLSALSDPSSTSTRRNP